MWNQDKASGDFGLQRTSEFENYTEMPPGKIFLHDNQGTFGKPFPKKKTKKKENDLLFQSSNGTTGLTTNRRSEKAVMLFYFHLQSSVILTSLNEILCPTLFPQGKKIHLSVKNWTFSESIWK